MYRFEGRWLQVQVWPIDHLQPKKKNNPQQKCLSLTTTNTALSSETQKFLCTMKNGIQKRLNICTTHLVTAYRTLPLKGYMPGCGLRGNKYLEMLVKINILINVWIPRIHFYMSEVRARYWTT